MKQLSKYLLAFLMFLGGLTGFYSQNFGVNQSTFELRGSVIESETRDPISKVNIQVNGGAYTTSNMTGEFRIKVKIGDEIVISHKDFETVYYTVKNQDRITIEVEPNDSVIDKEEYFRKDSNFNSLLDSAIVNKKEDPNKSLQFITDALGQSRSSKQNADAYEVLADVFIQLKQYDLAINNYRISLQSIDRIEVKLKLAKAYELNKNYQESIEVYKSIKVADLPNYSQVEYYEGLGDVHLKIQEYNLAIDYYNRFLAISKPRL